ncbi:MAG: NADH:flavin oxidoreductase [Bacteroidaceae bacterium]|nr:NADH:flavin oxidoreductase [Bacteroidaceae bacterium]
MKLLTPISIGNVQLKNRIMFPPMTTGYEEPDGSIGEKSLQFYKRIAQGGTGYIVLGDVAPVRTVTPTPKLFTDSQIPSFAALTEALHEYGAKVAAQLFYPEYNVPEINGLIAKARSMQTPDEKARATQAAYARMHYDMQHFSTEATKEQLQQIKDDMKACAVRCAKAGFDAIEIHGDRLLGSFSSALLNHRSDEYGGTLQNRARFSVELIHELKTAVPELIIEYKLPVITVNEDGTLRGKGGLTAEEAPEFARMLQDAGVDFIQVAQANHTGDLSDTIPPRKSVPYCWTLPIATLVKRAVNIPVATVGWVVTPERGEEILNEDKADVIGYGRPLLADPDLPLKAANGDNVLICTGCNKACVGGLLSRKPISCIRHLTNKTQG